MLTVFSLYVHLSDCLWFSQNSSYSQVMCHLLFCFCFLFCFGVFFFFFLVLFCFRIWYPFPPSSLFSLFHKEKFWQKTCKSSKRTSLCSNLLVQFSSKQFSSATSTKIGYRAIDQSSFMNSYIPILNILTYLTLV